MKDTEIRIDKSVVKIKSCIYGCGRTFKYNGIYMSHKDIKIIITANKKVCYNQLNKK